jgi:hypothetical protein
MTVPGMDRVLPGVDKVVIGQFAFTIHTGITPRTLRAELTSTIVVFVVTSVVDISTTRWPFDFMLVAIDRLFHNDSFLIK